jgi:predicted anti-sigma-YlaC factor YlaD
MKCDFEKLCHYLEGELNPKAQMEVLRHLKSCEICREAVFQIAQDHGTRLVIQHELQKAAGVERQRPR